MLHEAKIELWQSSAKDFARRSQTGRIEARNPYDIYEVPQPNEGGTKC
jgi:hypothetical protein